MTAIKGHYNGSVVVLDEPAPVDHETEVVVQFPDDRPAGRPARRFHWEEARARIDSLRGSVSEELLRQRRAE